MVMLVEKSGLLCSQIHWLMIIGFLLCISLACVQSSFGIQGVHVEELVMTRSLDKNGKPVDNVAVFQPDTDRIYCFASVPTLANKELTLQWYHEDNLIGAVENYASTDGEVSWYLEQPVGYISFPEGQYHVELYYITVRLASRSFSVEK